MRHKVTLRAILAHVKKRQQRCHVPQKFKVLIRTLASTTSSRCNSKVRLRN